jgi:hypothetical protein
MRVYELAKELKITSRQVNAIAMRCGIPIRSAAAVVPPDVEDMIRTRHKLDLAGPPPARRPGARHGLPAFGPVPRPKARRDRYRGKLDDLGTLVRWMLEERVLPARDRLYVRGGPYVDEVKQAEELALPWVAEWFEPKLAIHWLTVHPDVHADTAAALRSVGITPEEALRRPWYGKDNPGRPTIVERVNARLITAEQALQELRSIA